MRHYSYTRLGLFEICPRAYKLKYVDRVPEAPSDALIIGRLVHEIIAEYDRHLLANNLETDITVLPEITRRVFYREPNQLGSNRLPEIEAIMETFAQSHIFHPALTVGIEEQIKIQLTPDITFWGVLDLLEIDGTTATIVDYKTDWAVRSQAEVEKDFQLQVYAWAVTKEYPQVDTFKARLEFVRHAVIREVEIDAAAVAKTEAKLLGLIDQVEKECEFAPRPGAGCSWCSYIEMCPALKNLNGQIICKSQEDAVRIAGELALLEKQVADRKEALKQWCTVNGMVEANGLAWGFYPTISKSIEDPRRFAEIVSGLGDDPYNYLTVDGRKAKKLWNKPEVAAALEAISVDKSYTTFTSRKLKGGEV